MSEGDVILLNYNCYNMMFVHECEILNAPANLSLHLILMNLGYQHCLPELTNNTEI